MRRYWYGLLGIALASTGGCTYYATPIAQSPSVGTDVRLELDEPQTVDLSEAALRDIVSVEGPVLSWSADSVLVASNWVVSQRGTRNRTLGEHVGLLRVRITNIEEQRIHTGRTAALIAGGGVVVGGLFFALINGGNSSGSDGGNGGSGAVSGSLIGR